MTATTSTTDILSVHRDFFELLGSISTPVANSLLVFGKHNDDVDAFLRSDYYYASFCTKTALSTETEMTVDNYLRDHDDVSAEEANILEFFSQLIVSPHFFFVIPRARDQAGWSFWLKIVLVSPSEVLLLDVIRALVDPDLWLFPSEGRRVPNIEFYYGGHGSGEDGAGQRPNLTDYAYTGTWGDFSICISDETQLSLSEVWEGVASILLERCDDIASLNALLEGDPSIRGQQSGIVGRDVQFFGTYILCCECSCVETFLFGRSSGRLLHRPRTTEEGIVDYLLFSIPLGRHVGDSSAMLRVLGSWYECVSQRGFFILERPVAVSYKSIRHALDSPDAHVTNEVTTFANSPTDAILLVDVHGDCCFISAVVGGVRSIVLLDCGSIQKPRTDPATGVVHDGSILKVLAAMSTHANIRNAQKICIVGSDDIDHWSGVKAIRTIVRKARFDSNGTLAHQADLRQIYHGFFDDIYLLHQETIDGKAKWNSWSPASVEGSEGPVLSNIHALPFHDTHDSFPLILGGLFCLNDLPGRGNDESVVVRTRNMICGSDRSARALQDVRARLTPPGFPMPRVWRVVHIPHHGSGVAGFRDTFWTDFPSEIYVFTFSTRLQRPGHDPTWVRMLESFANHFVVGAPPHFSLGQPVRIWAIRRELADIQVYFNDPNSNSRWLYNTATPAGFWNVVRDAQCLQ